MVSASTGRALQSSGVPDCRSTAISANAFLHRWACTTPALGPPLLIASLRSICVTQTAGVAVIPSPAGAPEDWEFHSGGAGLYGTAPDYIRLLRMLLRGGELNGTRILQARTVAAMWDNQIGSLPAGRIDSALPMLIRPFDPLSSQEGEWSLLGLRNPAAVAGGRSAGSAGWFGVAGTVFWIDRAADLCGVLLAQMMPFGDHALTASQQDFERAAYAGAATRHKEAA